MQTHYNFKIYFLDMDGTFVDKPEELPEGKLGISQENLDTVSKLAKSKPVIISTGRSNSDYLLRVAKLINAPYCVCQNGSLIVDSNNKQLQKIEIDEHSTQELIKYMQSRNLFYTMDEGGVIYYGKNYNCDFERPWVKLLKKVPYKDMPKIKKACKFLCYGVDKDGINQIIEELKVKLPHLTFHKVSYGYSIEITSDKASKGKGNAFVANLLNIDPKECVHIGDIGNDTNALPEIGSFIAMGNATDEVKSFAMKIAPDFRNAGLAKLIKELENM